MAIESFSRGDPTQARGKWKTVKGTGGREVPLISCPRCGLVFSIGRHSIDPVYSTVKPRVFCPVGCGWASYIFLSGWAQRKAKVKHGSEVQAGRSVDRP